jgi:ADP-ribosylation factor-like protein 1
MLAEEELKDTVLLIFANKQDLPTALSAEQLTEQLDLTSLKSRTWAIFRCSAVKGEGLKEGFDWLTSVVGS